MAARDQDSRTELERRIRNMRPWEDKIRKVTPYVPGEQPKIKDIIKLNTNENPYPPAPGVAKKLANLDVNAFTKYPDPNVSDLVNAIASFYGLDASQVFVGVGSDDVIAQSFMTFFNSDKPIMFPDITYSFYDVWAKLFNIPYETKPLNDSFEICASDYYGENGGIIFPNPNAPTGVAVSLSFIEDILKHNKDVIVIIDEAYVDFGTKSAMSLINHYDNLLVVQTFSKSRSAAGLRIGYACGNPELIAALNAVKQSYNSYTMNYPSIVLGVEIVNDRPYFEKCCKQVVDTREKTKEALSELGFTFPDSKTNFIFATHPKYDAKEIFEYLRNNNIIVRHFNAPRIDNYLRISIGTDAQMNRLIDVIKEYISKKKA